MDLLGQTCFAAAEKCEVKGQENQHPDMKVVGFVTACQAKSCCSPSQRRHCLSSHWLCSSLDKRLLTFESQKGCLSLNEAFQKVMEKKEKLGFFKASHRRLASYSC